MMERLMVDLHSAVAAPRLHNQLMPDQLLVENGFDKAVFTSLLEKGHNASWMAPGASAVQAIGRLPGGGRFDAVGETRQVNSGGLTV
jgi:gamma-glutamyltranspeptidase/glutathione hydrolase